MVKKPSNVLPVGAQLRLGSRSLRFDAKDWPAQLAISRDGSRVAAKVGDLKIRVWDANTGAELHLLRCKPHGGAGKRIETIVLSPDGALVATWIYNHLVVFDVATGELRHEIKDSGDEQIAFTPDGRYLVVPSGVGSPLRLYDLASGAICRQVHGHAHGMLGLSSDGHRLAIEHGDRIAIHDTESLECTLQLKVKFDASSGVEQLIFIDDRELLVNRYSVEHTTYVDLASGSQRAFEWPLPGTLYHLRVSPDGTLASALRSDKHVREVVNLKTGAVLLSLPGSTFHDAAFAQSRLALMERGAVRVFDTSTWRELALDGHSSEVTSVSFDGDTVVTSSSDSTRSWNRRTGALIAATEPTEVSRPIAAHGIWAQRDKEGGQWFVQGFRGETKLFAHPTADRPTRTAASPTEPAIAYTDWLGWLCVLDVDGRMRWSFQAPVKGRVRQPLVALAWSPDGSRVAAGGHGKFLMLFDARTGDQRIALKGHTANIEQIAFAPSGKLLLSRDSRTTRMWNVATGEHVGTLKGLWPHAWSADGRQAATIEFTSVLLWEPERALGSEAVALL